MARETSSDDVPLPETWPASVKSAVLLVISLAHLTIIYGRNWATRRVV